MQNLNSGLLRVLAAVIIVSAALAFGLPGVEAENQIMIAGTEPGWVALDHDDFVPVNGEAETWTWKDGLTMCSGQPIGVIRTARKYENFELLIEWSHQRTAGNSGVFAWVPESALEDLPPGRLPGAGIEVQMLDHGYTEQYQQRTGKRPTWFSTNGDVFPVGASTMKPFPPLSPNGQRSFPSKDLSKGFGKWNHYYVRAVNGEIRLWVNGEEVSGGRDCPPANGSLCLESAGSPIHFRNIRIRELP